MGAVEVTIDGARSVLLNVTGGDDVTLFEVQESASIIEEAVEPNANIIWGLLIDPNFPRGQVKVTLIATGFDEAKKAAPAPTTSPNPGRESLLGGSRPIMPRPNQGISTPLPSTRDGRTPSQPMPVRNLPNPSDVDIPVFLRRSRDKDRLGN